MTTAMQPRGQSVPAPHSKPQTFDEVLRANAARIQQAAGTLLDGGRLMSLALIAVGKTPALAKCSTTSLMQAVLDCARYGLEPDGVQAALVPYKGTAQAQPMYQGLITIAFDEPTLEAIEARTVREGDVFSVELGSSPTVRHLPALDADVLAVRPGVAYYAVAHMRGRATFEVMTRAEVEAIRVRSPAVKGGFSSPWDTDYDEMAKKTVLKRLLKKLPKRSRRLRDVIDHDNEIESGAIDAEIVPPPALPPRSWDIEHVVDLAETISEASDGEALANWRDAIAGVTQDRAAFVDGANGGRLLVASALDAMVERRAAQLAGVEWVGSDNATTGVRWLDAKIAKRRAVKAS